MPRSRDTYLTRHVGNWVDEDELYSAYQDALRYNRVNLLVLRLVPLITNVVYREVYNLVYADDVVSDIVLSLMGDEGRRKLLQRPEPFTAGGNLIRWTYSYTKYAVMDHMTAVRSEVIDWQPETMGTDLVASSPEDGLMLKEWEEFLHAFVRRNLRFTDPTLVDAVKLVLSEGEDYAVPILGPELGGFVADFLAVLSRVAHREYYARAQ